MRRNNRYIQPDPFGRPYDRMRIPVRTPQEKERRKRAATAETAAPQPAKPEPDVKAAEAKVEEAQATATEWKEKYTRLYAEQENLRKRLERRYASEAQKEKERLLLDILPLIDNLERALEHATAQETGLREGVELALKAFKDTLAKHGVQMIAAAGEPFDPERHEAIGVVPANTLPPDTVAQVEENGYTFQDKLLRPARVLVTAS